MFTNNYNDQEIRELFDDEEWKELTEDRLGIPDVPLNIAKEIARYGNKDLKELRKTIMTSYLPNDVPYDNNQHYDLEWIQTSIRTIVSLYQNDDSPLQRNQYEYWYTIALFGVCIDVAYRDAKLGTDVKSSNRKNRIKKNKRKLTGRKLDGIIYLVENLHEMGAIEGARSFNGLHDKKYLLEYFKMPKVLRDMLADLIIAVDYDAYKASKLQVFGIIHLGLKVQFIRMWRAGGSITIYKKDYPVHEVPSKFSVDKFKSFLKFLVSVYQYKMILKNNIQILYGDGNDSKEDTLLNDLLNIGRQQTPPPNTINYFAD
ncbi:7546_t:CDS:2, partial [Scutellospora calospora]